MIKIGLLLAILCTLQLHSPSLYAEPVPDRLIGTVTLRNTTKLDTKAKQEIANIVARIKKNRPGVIKVIGDFPAAQSQDEYIEKSVFMAKAVEEQLTSLLAGKFQVFVTATLRGEKKRVGQNSVAIRLYPHELIVMEEGSTSLQALSRDMPSTSEPVSEQAPPPAALQTTQPCLLTPPPVEDGEIVVTSRKEPPIKKDVEDHVFANELVNRAKARAAARAKQLERER